MNNYIWKIIELEYAPSLDGRTNVVQCVTWSCSLREIVGEHSYNAVAIGKSFIEYAPSAPFTPLTELVESQVWQWIEGKFDKDEIEKLVASEFLQKKNPPTEASIPPWVAENA